MKQNTNHAIRVGSLSFAFLLIGIMGNIFSSAKWGVALCGWISPLGFLYFIRFSKTRWKWVLFFLALTIASIVSAKDVAPFPLPVLFIVGLIEGVKVLLIYFTNEWVCRNKRQFLFTVYFPAAYTSLEFLNAGLGGGIWWSVANAQHGFSYFTQLASVTGIWGISFMVYWFASVLVWMIGESALKKPVFRGPLIYGMIFGSVLLFGAIRFHSQSSNQSNNVTIAGVTAPSFDFLTGLYSDFCGRQVSINPRISISSPELQEINRAQIPFIETADTIKFRKGYAAIREMRESLFNLSSKAADRGAKIILWSEANALVFAFDEQAVLARASQFAASRQVYLLAACAIIIPGKIDGRRKFIKNEAILFGPDGKIMNTFYKNNPVPFAEASIPGDGVIPVIPTRYGRIAVSICYDADFPVQMRQLGAKQAGLLLLPSGDWYAIAPYHSYMAIFRGIENGNSIFRQASGGLSIASDYRGKVLGSFDFYKPGEKLWFAEIPVGHIPTLYNRIGDAFAWICVLVTTILLTLVLTGHMIRKGSRVPDFKIVEGI